jgi:prepilin-type N-terminal cleavage/methylation domain-containing protein
MKINIHKLHGNVAQRRQGFTLTEIMLVVVIIGILAALVMPDPANGRASRPRRPISRAASNPPSVSTKSTTGFIRRASRT